MANPHPGALVLGSASPRRASLLTELGVPFTVSAVAIDEQSHLVRGDATASVVAIARAKFAAFQPSSSGQLLLTADTLVSCHDEIMGKPESPERLTLMLHQMSGNPLTVVTAVCSGPADAEPMTTTVQTTIQLRSITDQEVARYVETGVGMDKAGGLALQAEAGVFIAAVDGCWSNVLGLPVCAVAAALDLPPGGGQYERCSVALCGVHR